MTLTFDPSENIISLDGELVSFHCHHYNCGLLKTIEEINGIDGPALFAKAAAEEIFQVFRRRYCDQPETLPPEAALARAAELYSFMGFGKLDFTQVGAEGGLCHSCSSYFVTGWLAKYGRRKTPLCYFTCGFIAGVLGAVFDTGPTAYQVKEVRCMIQGHERCRFLVSRENDGR